MPRSTAASPPTSRPRSTPTSTTAPCPRYTTAGNAGTVGATQTAQALALDAGLVPDGERQAVLDALVELVYAFHANGTGPHFIGGTIDMAPTVRALAAAGRDDVLWEVLQQNDEPSYRFFMAPPIPTA